MYLVYLHIHICSTSENLPRLILWHHDGSMINESDHIYEYIYTHTYDSVHVVSLISSKTVHIGSLIAYRKKCTALSPGFVARHVFTASCSRSLQESLSGSRQGSCPGMLLRPHNIGTYIYIYTHIYIYIHIQIYNIRQ